MLSVGDALEDIRPYDLDVYMLEQCLYCLAIYFFCGILLVISAYVQHQYRGLRLDAAYFL